MNKIERIREHFLLRGWPSPKDIFTDEEILNMAEKTYVGNCILLNIAWEDFITQLKQSLFKWFIKSTAR